MRVREVRRYRKRRRKESKGGKKKMLGMKLKEQ